MKHGVGIIGAGIGAEHLAGYRALPDRFDVRWMCDLDLDRARAAAGAEIAVTLDLADLLADPKCTVIDICLPPHLHLPVAQQALSAGKQVICEKPLVTSLAEIDQLSATAKNANGQVFPVFQYRFGQGMAQLRALLRADLTGPGQVATLETHWSRDAAYYATGWRGTWSGERGGAIVTHAIHIHDLIREAFGPIAQVQAQLDTRINPIETDDCAALILKTTDGALVTSSVTLGAATDQSRLRLVYRDVTVDSDLAPYAPAAAPWTFRARTPAHQARIDAVLRDVPSGPAGFAGFLSAVADTLDGRVSDAVTLADARAALDLITGIYASARTNRSQSLPIPRTHPLYSSWLPEKDTP